MRDRLPELHQTDVVVVTFAEGAELVDYHDRLNMPFRLLADPTRAAYRRFGLDRGSMLEVWNLNTLRLYVRLLARGRRLHRPRHDTRQLGGDFVVGPDGRLVAAFRPRSPDDRPSMAALFEPLT